MKLNKLLLALAASGIATSAFATNGMFAHGFGMKAKGMGGASIAFAQDGLAAANNPAGMVLVGDRTDVGLEWFSPVRESKIDSTLYKSGSESFFVPEFGYNRMIKPNMSFGVSVYGNGGMNTDYASIPNFASSSGKKTGIDLSQLFIAPTLAYKLSETSAVGVSLNLAYQRFKASGISGFNYYSSSSANLSDNGYDDSTGYGVKLGWTGKVADNVTVGATYQSRTYMTKFDKYKGLFAEQGDLDVPENYGIGIAVLVNPKTTFAFDVVEIKYGDVKSMANNIALLAPGTLGNNNGAGFGWTDQTVYKVGVSHEVNDKLTIRAGYNHGDSTIPATELAFGVLAPAVVEDHWTLGATWKLKEGELTAYALHVPERTQTGSGATLGATTATLTMGQTALGLSYRMNF